MKSLIIFSVLISSALFQGCGVDGMAPRKRVFSGTATDDNVSSEPLTNPNGCYCTYEYRPVCGIKNGVATTYSNPCAAGCDGLTEVTEGECP